MDNDGQFTIVDNWQCWTMVIGGQCIMVDNGQWLKMYNVGQWTMVDIGQWTIPQHAANGKKCFKMVRNCPKSSKMFPKSLKWS